MSMEMEIIFKKRRLLTEILACVGIGIILSYVVCSDSCRYLKGSVFGIDLKYLGLVFMAFLFILNILKKDMLNILFLSLGLGAEIFLIGYQAANEVFCPFCSAFGAVLILMFILNFDKTKIPLIALSMLLGLVFFLLVFKGSRTPAYAGENLITSFGSGRVEVRLYTDYFCGPCRAAEPEIESLLTNLMNNNTIRITFIDTPIHKETILYAKYILYILNGSQRTFSSILAARSALYEAAGQNIRNNNALEAFLSKKGFTLKPFDTTSVFKAFENHIKEDGINSTPSCVISGLNKKESFLGGANIIKGLKGILETNKEKSAAMPPAGK